MQNLEPLTIKPTPPIPLWLMWAFILLSLAGLGDASYLTAKHYLGVPVACSVFEGCDKVLTSQYAVWWGVPVALLGVAYYLTLLILAAGFVFTGRVALFRFAAMLTAAGFAASLWFIYLQLFVINAVCLYCLISSVASTLLFILGIYALKITNKKDAYGK